MQVDRIKFYPYVPQRVAQKRDFAVFASKTQHLSYAIYRTATVPMTPSDLTTPNHPHFVKFGSAFTVYVSNNGISNDID